MDRRSRAVMPLTLIVVLSLLMPATVLAKGPGGGSHTEVATNNLSFPAIAADGASITDVPELFTVPYLNPNGSLFTIPGEVPEAPWYAQKVDGNKWSADFRTATDVVLVLGVDWGDNIESVSPTIGRPYRLETALFVDVSAAPLDGYRMGMLANPSSPDEIQGTNTGKYASNYATIYSAKPGLRIQNITSVDTDTLSWDEATNLWVSSTGATIPETTISFAPELNVAGKYIFGASTGGWKPTAVGTYRITFYIPATSQIVTSGDTTLGNLVEGVWVAGTAGEGGAVPQLRWDLNLTYVDVQVIAKGGGGKPS